MFRFAGYIGIYSYVIFFLGIFSLLTKSNIQIITILWLLVVLIIENKKVYEFLHKRNKFHLKLITENRINYLLCSIVIIQAIINLIGALGPELAFDSLWYHLTLPKLYLLHHSLYEIRSNLLYYGDMPKLGEMLYIGALSWGSEILAKVFHFVFGILNSLVLYKFSRKFFNQNISLLITCIFYANLVVDWESITAYIDLIRTFLEFLALLGLLNWYETQKNKWLVVSGIMIGLAMTTKVLAVGSFFILLALIVSINIKNKKSMRELIKGSLLYSFFSFIIPLPWFIYSFIYTGNAVYPFFTKTYEVTANPPDLLKIIPDFWSLFIHSSDPISPLYILFLPLLFVFYAKLKQEIKIIIWYCGLSLILWYFTPRTGGGRFILPYLPAFSFVCGAIYSETLKRTRKEWHYISKILFFSILFVSLVSICYRGIANKKYIPVILGQETKQEFLSNNLNFHFGDFYDVDGDFADHIKPTDTVLLYGFHNLYYVNFPFIDYTWVKKGDKFNFIATQNMKIPKKYANWQLIYSNDKTMVQLFKPPKGKCPTLCEY
jgi:hypothetical protein